MHAGSFRYLSCSPISLNLSEYLNNELPLIKPKLLGIVTTGSRLSFGGCASVLPGIKGKGLLSVAKL